MTGTLATMLNRFLACSRALRRNSDANVTLIAATALIPTLFGLGFCIDYARAEMLQSRIDAVADAAALTATDPIYNSQTSTVAQAAATNVFTTQVTDYKDFSYDSGNTSNLNITVVDGATINGVSTNNNRLATVTWSGTSLNMFSGILGSPALAIGGTSEAEASLPPSINFYVALDMSPSMLLPTSTSGIANLQAGAIWGGYDRTFNTTGTVGCDFACHSVNMQQWNNGVYVIDANKYEIFLDSATNTTIYRVDCSGNVYDANSNKIGASASVLSGSNSAGYYCAQNTTVYANPVTLKYKATGATTYTTVSVNFPDTWWLAQNYGTVNPGQSQILLRTDDEASAAAGVIQYAYSFEQQYANSQVPPKYQMQFYTFDIGAPAKLASPFDTMTDVKTLATDTFPNLGAQAPNLAAISYWTTTSVYTGNADSDFAAMLNGMTSILPTVQGAGTQSSPDNVLLIITDGLVDSTAEGISSLTAADVNKCNAIKTSGTRIAILYTTYDPATVSGTVDSTFNNVINNNLPSVLSQLQACATKNPDGTYLMQTVTAGQSLSTALNALFAAAVLNSHLAM